MRASTGHEPPGVIASVAKQSRGVRRYPGLLRRCAPRNDASTTYDMGSWRAQRSNDAVAGQICVYVSPCAQRPPPTTDNRQPTTEENMPAIGAWCPQLHRHCALQQTKFRAQLIPINALSTIQPLAQALRKISRSSRPGGRCCWGKTPARRTGADARGSCFSPPAFPSPLRVVPFGDGCDGHDHVT